MKSCDDMEEQPARFFEDFPVGFAFESATAEMTLESIAAFAAEFDPQPFHMDPDAGEASIFGRLVASGWHTAGVTMRLMVGTGLFDATGLIGLGVDEIRWPRPTLPGDVLRVRGEVVEATPSRTGRRGTIRWEVTTSNAKGEPVMTMRTLTLFPSRPA